MDGRGLLDHEARRRRAVIRSKRRDRERLAGSALHDSVDEGRVRVARRVGTSVCRVARAQEAGIHRRQQSPVHRQAAGIERGVCRRARLDRPGLRGEESLMARSRWRDHPIIDAASTWIIAYAARLWGVLLVGVVIALSWHALRGIHTRAVRGILEQLDARALMVAGLVTLLNIAIMGFYDVIAFADTRTRATERWRFGAVAFCWSNFLTLGPLAGPAIRYWLYRRRVTEVSELHPGIVSVIIAFVSGLAGWTAAVLVVRRI